MMNKQKTYILFGLFWLCGFGLKAQLIGSEQTVAKQLYTGTFTVAGDKDTYYPVVFKNAYQNKINHLRIYRDFSEPGPNELSSTHKGGLLLEFEVNYGSWGGITYDWRVSNIRQAYHTTFANAAHAMHYKGFVVWLRGGGFQYHYESEEPANLQVAYSSTERIYDHPSNDSYDSYAPEPLVKVNTANIDAHLAKPLLEVQKQNARATGYAVVAARNPGLDFSIFVIPWDGSNTLEQNAQSQINTDWHAQAVVKGNYFNQAFEGSDFSKYSTVLLSQASFDQYKSLTGNWWIVCSTLPPFSEQVHYMSKVGIGTTDTKGYQLAVGGQAVAEKIRIRKQADWADFVFDDRHVLPALEELEKQIESLGRLPGMPSAAEVAADGYDLSELDVKLLQKIEELSLYLIEQNKKIKKLEEKVGD